MVTALWAAFVAGIASGAVPLATAWALVESFRRLRARDRRHGAIVHYRKGRAPEVIL